MTEFCDLITIAIPVYERYQFFEEAINSALNQTVKCRVIVVDNCSSHNKFEKFVAVLNIDTVSYFRNDTNLGMTGNWNVCLDRAITDWVTILHDDDLLFPNYVEIFEKIIKKFPNVYCISSGCIKGLKPPPNYRDRLNYDVKIRKFDSQEFNYNELSPFPGVAINKKICNISFNDSMYPIADFDYWVRISKIGTILKFSAIQAYYRLDQAQTTSKVIDEIIRSAYFYRKREVVPNSFVNKLIFLASTTVTILKANKLYHKAIDVYDIVYDDDKAIVRLLKNKLILYAIYILKYGIYRFKWLFPYKGN